MMPRRIRGKLVSCMVCGALLALCLRGFAADPATDPAAPEFPAAELLFFAEKVHPVLEANCFKCHGPSEFKGGLSLTNRAAILAGGESGPAVDLAQPAESVLVSAINYQAYEMPPTGKLSPPDIATLTEWVARGLPMPATVEVADAAHHAPVVNDETRAFWSFQPVRRPELPQRTGPEVHPIDAFVRAKLTENGLSPNPPAEPHALYRRLHYDLLGLPPEPEQMERFVAGYAVDAEATWTRTVDELLASPHYGEHWARFWLDLVRYAETNSYERDGAKPFVWRYRDYVIRSLNADKPYDQFIREQLAGDELDAVTPETLIATGYYRLGLWDDEPADPELAYFDGLDDIIATTSQAFLGLSMNCARCHDHKLDPIPQADYYRLLAYFRNVRHYGVRSDESVQEASLRSIASPEEEHSSEAERQAWRARLKELHDAIDELEDRIQPQLAGGEIDDFKSDSNRLHVIENHVGELLTQAEFDTYAAQRREWSELKRNPPRSAEQALVVKEHEGDVPVTHVLLRGNPLSKGDVVEPGLPEVLGATVPEIRRPASGESSGRRRALAEWIASSDNPLTARVMVNRLWQQHFGHGIVRSTNNFGFQGDRPTHPELLDWLATEFVARGWSLKALHRVILSSQTYRQSSASEPTALAQDPQNNLLWRFDMRRLRAEEIRDSILAANRTLNLDAMYGPSIYPTMPAEVLAGQSQPGKGWETSSPEEARRRSVYIHIKRSLQLPILASFDAADTDFTCPERFVSTQPTQALGMLNSDFVNEQAAVLAELAGGSNAEARAFTSAALRRVLQREPSAEEIDRGMRLMENLERNHGLSAAEARRQLCLVALNLNEFVYLD